MGAIELRNKIIELLNTENISYLEDIFEFAEKKKSSTSEKDIVAYTIKEEPITRSQYVENNNQAVASFKKGDFKTQSQMRQKYQAR